MATELKLPHLGQGMESGTIVRWLKQEGDPVHRNEPLYELDTDKVTQEIEADADGVLVEIVVPEGEVAVGATIALIEAESGEPASTRQQPLRGPAEAAVPAAAAAPADIAAPAPPPAPAPPAPVVATPGGTHVKASPLARRIARERGLDLAAVVGTGPDGRIVAEDVERAPAGPPPAAAPLATGGEVELIRLTSVRKTIARRLSEAWSAPVFQLGVSADMTEALALREQLVSGLADGDVKPTVGDVLTRLVASALMRHRALNATFDGETIACHPQAHVGIAVAAANGLVVPVIRGAERSTVQEIARRRADIVGRARDGRLTLEDMQGGTFTISNLGMYGIEQFVAVLNPPQVAILAVGAVKETPVAIDGELDVAPRMQMTLTCDHRAIDGADGAEFLRTLVALVEHPALAL